MRVGAFNTAGRSKRPSKFDFVFEGIKEEEKEQVNSAIGGGSDDNISLDIDMNKINLS